MKRLPSLNALRAFYVAARHSSFARAAEELHVTPAAVSQLVKQLEEDIGHVLFKRGKSLTLSDTAGAALPLLKEGFDQLQRAADRLRLSAGTGPLVVSSPPTYASRWLIPRLPEFHARNPDIELRLLGDRRLVDFDLEDIDLAIRFGSAPFAGLETIALQTECIVPVAAPALAATLERPSDLLHSTLLHDEYTDWDPSFPDWHNWLASLGLNVPQTLRTRYFGDISLVIEATISGLGVAMVWRSLVIDDIHAGRLVPLFGHTIATPNRYHLVVPPHRAELHKVRMFRQWLQTQIVEE